MCDEEMSVRQLSGDARAVPRYQDLHVGAAEQLLLYGKKKIPDQRTEKVRFFPWPLGDNTVPGDYLDIDCQL